jgi:hypothetical protein
VTVYKLVGAVSGDGEEKTFDFLGKPVTIKLEGTIGEALIVRGPDDYLRYGYSHLEDFLERVQKVAGIKDVIYVGDDIEFLQAQKIEGAACPTNIDDRG